MKTTNAHFAKFQDAFLFWQRELGMMEYAANFCLEEFEDTKLACISIDHEGRCCKVRLNSELLPQYLTESELNLHAKHEALHLLMSRLHSLAHSRYVMEREIEDAEEGIVRVLERLL